MNYISKKAKIFFISTICIVFVFASGFIGSQTQKPTVESLVLPGTEKGITYPYRPDMLHDPRLQLPNKKKLTRVYLFIVPFRSCTKNPSPQWRGKAWAQYLKNQLANSVYSRRHLFYQTKLAPLSEQSDKKNFYIDLEKYLNEDSRYQPNVADLFPDAPWNDPRKKKNHFDQNTQVYTHILNVPWKEFAADSDWCTNKSKTIHKTEWLKFFHATAKDLYQSMRIQKTDAHFQFFILAGHYSEGAKGSQNNEGDPKRQILDYEFALFDSFTGEIFLQNKYRITGQNEWTSLSQVVSTIKEKFLAGSASLDLGHARPGFRIYINDIYYGMTPLKIKGLQPGFYALRMEKKGFRIYQTNIALNANEHKKVSVKFKKIEYKNSILIHSAKPGNVFVNGRFLGPSPVKMTNLEVGQHRVRIHYQDNKFSEHSFAITNEDCVSSESTQKPKTKQVLLGNEYYQSSYSQVYKPYRGFNFFRNGNNFEILGKYSLAASVLSFTMALVTDGLYKRKVDIKALDGVLHTETYHSMTKVFVGAGFTTLTASGVLFYFSLYKDDESFVFENTENTMNMMETVLSGYPGSVFQSQLGSNPVCALGNIPRTKQEIVYNFGLKKNF